MSSQSLSDRVWMSSQSLSDRACQRSRQAGVDKKKRIPISNSTVWDSDTEIEMFSHEIPIAILNS